MEGTNAAPDNSHLRLDMSYLSITFDEPRWSYQASALISMRSSRCKHDDAENETDEDGRHDDAASDLVSLNS
jgi:hypothetical protein